MKNIFKYIGLIGFCLLSFYYTEKVSLYVKSKNPTMQLLQEASTTLNTEYVNATIIDDTYIIPGITGKEVNVDASFRHMTSSYDPNNIIYNSIIPEISISNNKDKIISRGNSLKNSVSILFENTNSITEYLKNQNYEITILLDQEKYISGYEYINNAKQKKLYDTIEKKLAKIQKNNLYCYRHKSNFSSLCQNKYLFIPSLILNQSNFTNNISNISSGEIILLSNNLSKEQINILINEIKSQQLSIVYLSTLLNE